jgi:hypothetical protein
MRMNKQQLFKRLALRLGDGLVDVELDPEHYETAFEFALLVYRQRAQNATKEAYAELTLIEHKDSYILPAEFINVKKVLRRGMGQYTGQSANHFDPFAQASLNTYVMLAQGPGGLTNYELYSGYLELTAKMFGGHLIHKFDSVTKELKIVRDIKNTGEKVIIWGDIARRNEDLLADQHVGIWLADWTLSELKSMLGEAREKFGTIQGPGGGTSLNGSALKAEAKAMQEKLLADLESHVDGSDPLTWITG